MEVSLETKPSNLLQEKNGFNLFFTTLKRWKDFNSTGFGDGEWNGTEQSGKKKKLYKIKWNISSFSCCHQSLFVDPENAKEAK